MEKIPTAEELAIGYKDFYILLESSMLGERFDIIKCLSTREGHTTIRKANGCEHFFASSMAYGLENKWFVPFSHTEYAKLYVTEALKQASTSKSIVTKYTEDGLDYQTHALNTNSVLNAYPLTNIK